MDSTILVVLQVNKKNSFHFDRYSHKYFSDASNGIKTVLIVNVHIQEAVLEDVALSRQMDFFFRSLDLTTVNPGGYLSFSKGYLLTFYGVLITYLAILVQSV